MMSLRAWIYLLLLSSFWGASFYFIEVGLEHLSPVWLVSLRLISGYLFMCMVDHHLCFFALSAGVLARLSCHGCAE